MSGTFETAVLRDFPFLYDPSFLKKGKQGFDKNIRAVKFLL